MATLRWAVLVERAIIEADTGNLSLISIIEEVRMKRPTQEALAGNKRPLVPHRFSIVQVWERSNPKDPEQITVRSRLSGPNGKTYARIEHAVDLKNHTSCRVIGTAPGFPLLGEGAYSVDILLSKGKAWRKVSSQSFNVVFTS